MQATEEFNSGYVRMEWTYRSLFFELSWYESVSLTPMPPIESNRIESNRIESTPTGSPMRFESSSRRPIRCQLNHRRRLSSGWHFLRLCQFVEDLPRSRDWIGWKTNQTTNDEAQNGLLGWLFMLNGPSDGCSFLLLLHFYSAWIRDDSIDMLLVLNFRLCPSVSIGLQFRTHSFFRSRVHPPL
jgi:hypothetical protein